MLPFDLSKHSNSWLREEINARRKRLNQVGAEAQASHPSTEPDEARSDILEELQILQIVLDARNSEHQSDYDDCSLADAEDNADLDAMWPSMPSIPGGFPATWGPAAPNFRGMEDLGLARPSSTLRGNNDLEFSACEGQRQPSPTVQDELSNQRSGASERMLPPIASRNGLNHVTPPRPVISIDSSSASSRNPTPDRVSVHSSLGESNQYNARKRLLSSPATYYNDHRSKTARHSNASTARPDTPASQHSTTSLPDDLPDEILAMFGTEEEARSQLREMRRYQQELDERQTRERADEEFARQLQAEYNRPNSHVSSQNSSTPGLSTNADLQRYQTYLDSGGNLRRDEPLLTGVDTSSTFLPTMNAQSLPGPSYDTSLSQGLPSKRVPTIHELSGFSPVTSGLAQDRPHQRVPEILNLDSDTSDSDLSIVPLNRRNPGFDSRSPDAGFSRRPLPWGDTHGYSYRPSQMPQRSRPFPPAWDPRPSTHSAGGTSVYSTGNSSNTSMFGSLYNGISSVTSALSGSINNASWMRPIDVDSLPERSVPSFNSSFPSFTSISGPWFDQSQAALEIMNDGYQDPKETAKEIKDLMNNIRPDEELGASDRTGSPEDMAEGCALYEHQKLGLGWMIQMEEGTNKGGILADDMGLGKTIQAIALMVSRRSEDRNQKTTLIVAPLALLRQWENEIKLKVRPDRQLSTYIYHGPKRKTHFNQLKTFDVVLTTYGTLASELRTKEALDKDAKANPGQRQHQDYNALLPLLGSQSKFHRVILDEAQNIKNKNTKSFQAVSSLQARTRFCMTGTPMMNNVGELYALINFLRIRPYSEWRRFQNDIMMPLREQTASTSDNAMRKLQALLKAILLRRTKKSEINGKPILTLPERTTVVEHALMEGDQLEFYKALENQTQLRFNRYLRAGTVGRNYHGVLLLLLRLRQACCHPHLIRNDAENVAGTTEKTPEELEQIARDFLSKEAVKRLLEEGQVDCQICMDAVEKYDRIDLSDPADNISSTIFTPCGHATCSECFVRISDPSQAVDDGTDSRNKFRCMSCRGPVDPTKVTDWNSFQKVFKQQDDVVEAETSSDSEAEAGSESDSEDIEEEDDDETDSLDGFIVKDEFDRNDVTNAKADPAAEVEDQSLKGEPKDSPNADAGEPCSRTSKEKNPKANLKKKEKKKKKGKGKRKEKLNIKLRNPTLSELQKESKRNLQAKRQYFTKLKEDFVSSAKIDKCLEILDKIAAKRTGEKTIVFSQFTTFLDLLEVPFMERNWLYKRYDGSMSATARNEAVLEFTARPRCRIMLVSLKAGNSGLNLTAANNVIILDPFWNPYIEEQAVDRVHRIGQRLPVYCHRILIQGTVEDRIMDIQERKRHMIEGALDEKASQGIARLDAQDLAYLFGVTS